MTIRVVLADDQTLVAPDCASSSPTPTTMG